MKAPVFWILFALGLAAFSLAGRGDPQALAQAPVDGREPVLVAATFSSAWCSACKVLEPRLSKAAPAFAGEPIRFVRFDFTFGERDELRAAAEAAGVGDIYDRFKGATGFTVLVDADTGEVIDTLTINHSADAMRLALAGALASAARR